MIARLFGKGAVIALEVMGLLVLTLTAGLLALMLRLQQGPLPLDFVTEKVEAAFARYQNGFVFDIDKTTLIWGGHVDPFMLEMRDVRVRRSDGTPVAVVERARVVLSKRGLLLGRVIPKDFYLYSPVLRVVRNLDGAFSLNVGDGGALPSTAAVEQAWDETVDKHSAVDPVAQRQFIATLMETMRNPEWHGVLGGLQRITIDDAALAYDDRMLGVVWKAEHAKIVLAKVDRGIVADTVFAWNVGAGADVESAVVRLRASHVWEQAQTRAELFFTGINPSLLAVQSDKLAAVRDVDVALKGQVVLTLDDTMHPAHLSFRVGSEAGRFNAAEIYPAPIDIAGFMIDGEYDILRNKGQVNDLRVNLGGPKVEATAQIEKVAPHTAADGTTVEVAGYRIAAQGTLLDMPMDDLGRYWSAKLAPDAQAWVTQNLKVGTATRATIDTALVHGDDGRIQLEKLGGTIDFTDLAVNYFPPMRKVTGVTGQAVYDVNAFNIKVSTGKLDDIAVTGGQVDITNLAHSHAADDHARIDIAVALDGPLKTALSVIDSEPLRYPTALGLKLDGIAGTARTGVTFGFPLHHALDVDEVEVTAKSVIADAVVPDVAMGQALSGGPFALSLAKGQLRVTGDGRFGDAGIKLDWSKNFTDKARPAMELSATLTAPAAMLPVFGVPAEVKTSGFMPARVTMTERQDATATLMLEGDLTPLGIDVDLLSAAKAEGEAGTVTLELDMKNQQPVSLRRIKIDTPALTANGSIDFASTAQGVTVRRVGLGALRFGQSDLGEVTASIAPGAAAYDVTVKGRQLDASALFADDDTPNTDAEASRKSPPVSINLAVDRLMTGTDKGLDAVTLRLIRNDFRRIEQLELTATAGGKPVMARYLPTLNGGRSLRFEAGDAGATLAALGVTTALRGGQIVVDAQPALDPANARETLRDMAGTLVLSNFEVRNAPVLAKLLNAMSLSGIRDLLNNKGLSFKRARARFSYSDRGQPATDRNQRAVRLAEGQTSGSSMGLMFEGTVDLWSKALDLHGTIVPVSDINKILEKIPLLGTVLTAGGEGIFAATYKITGSQQDPDVSVNPLSVLAPGVLRKIFFED